MSLLVLGYPNISKDVPTCIDLYSYVLVCTFHESTYQYIPVHTSTYSYIQVHTCYKLQDVDFTDLNTVLAGLGMEQFPLQLLCTLMVAL